MAILALIQSDPDQAKQAVAMVAGMMGIFVCIGLGFMAFMIFLMWRIFAKAGFPGPMAFIALIPGVGALIALCILAFGDWKVVPATQAIAYPPSYPPPSGYPPAPPPAV